MTSPPDPPAPQNGPQTAPGPPEPAAPDQPGTPAPGAAAGGQDGSQGRADGDDPAELRAALAAARRDLKRAAGDLDKLRRQGMTDQEAAVAEARAQGKAEAMREQGVKIAAAEFRALAAGRFADPAKAATRVNLREFVDEDGNVDSAALAEAVEDLAAAVAPQGNGVPAPRVPAGPRQPSAGDREDTWMRDALRSGP